MSTALSTKSSGSGTPRERRGVHLVPAARDTPGSCPALPPHPALARTASSDGPIAGPAPSVLAPGGDQVGRLHAAERAAGPRSLPFSLHIRAVGWKGDVMKIIADQRPLADAVAWTADVLPTRPAAPLFAGLRVDAGQRLTLSAYDIDSSARAAAPATIQAEGVAIVPGRLFAGILRGLPAQPVEIRADRDRLIIACGAARFSLMTLAGEKYPALPEMPPPDGTVGSDLLSAAIRQVGVAASDDDTLPPLTCIHAGFDGCTLALMATDRYRIAIRKMRWQPALTRPSGAALIPARALDSIARAACAAAETTIAFGGLDDGGGGVAGFATGGRQLTTRLIGGQFPRYQAPPPSDVTAVAELPVGLLADAVRRAALVTGRSLPLRMTFSAGQVLLEAGAGDDGAQAAETLEAGYEGEGIHIAFNPWYLLDGLTAVDSDTVRIALTSAAGPAMLAGKPDGDAMMPDYQYVLMPVREDQES
jgi:DNA polymerase III subunit beta